MGVTTLDGKTPVIERIREKLKGSTPAAGGIAAMRNNVVESNKNIGPVIKDFLDDISSIIADELYGEIMGSKDDTPEIMICDKEGL